MAGLIPSASRMYLPVFNSFPYIPSCDKVPEDLNTIHLSLTQGLTLLYCNPNVANIPAGSNALCIHLQRLKNGNISSSQYITQIIFSTTKLYYRSGIGNGNDITWKEWTGV